MINLEIKEMAFRDRGRGRIRIHHTLFEKMGVESMCIVQVKGEHNTVAIAHRHQFDKDVVLADTFVRNNAGVRVGDMVEIAPIIPEYAEHVYISELPHQEYHPNISLSNISRAIMGRPLTVNDSFMVDYEGVGYVYMVMGTIPSDAPVSFTDDTELIMMDGETESVLSEDLHDYFDRVKRRQKLYWDVKTANKVVIGTKTKSMDRLYMVICAKHLEVSEDLSERLTVLDDKFDSEHCMSYTCCKKCAKHGTCDQSYIDYNRLIHYFRKLGGLTVEREIVMVEDNQSDSTG